MTITFSKGIARGRIQLERYHLHVLKTLKETRNAVHYVLFNKQKHSRLKQAYINSFSSLGLVQGLRELAKAASMTVILNRVQEYNFLDEPFRDG